MKFKTVIYVILALILFCVVVFICRSKSQACNSNISPQKLRGEVDFLYTQINKVDPDPYINCRKPQIDSLAKAIKVSITDSMTSMQYYRLIRPLVSAFNDGHLALFPEKDFKGKLFPFKVVINSGSIFIKENLTSNDPILHGTEIKSVNNIPAPQLIKTLLAFFSGDSYPYKLKTVEENFATGLWRAYGFQGNFSIMLSNGNKLTVPGIPLTKQPDKVPSLKLLKQVKGQIALITVPSLVIDNKKQFDHFLDSSFTLIYQLKINRLIIDIRNNGGGSTLLARSVFNYIANKPYSVSREEITFYNGSVLRNIDTALTKPILLKNKFAGKIFLLMNSGSYSSAHMMANAFKYYKMGITVGDSSCERMRISGEVNKIILPASKLIMYCPSSAFILPFVSNQHSRLIPDYIISLTFKDKMENYDRQLQFCLKMAANR
jgi:hypothetical protein